MSKEYRIKVNKFIGIGNYRKAPRGLQIDRSHLVSRYILYTPEYRLYTISIFFACLFVYLFVCLFVTNNRDNGLTDRAHIFRGTSCDPRKGQNKFTIVLVEVHISIYCCSAYIRIYLLLDNELDRKIGVTAMQFPLVQNRHQTHD